LFKKKSKALRKNKEEFEQTVQQQPAETGIDAPAWTPALVQQ